MSQSPTSSARPPQLLVLPGTRDGGNLGDLAMLQIALERLHARWPDARLRVLTHVPERLREQCPLAEPVSLRGADQWLRAKILPRWLWPAREAAWRRRQPDRFYRWWWRKAAMRPARYRAAGEFVQELGRADGLVVTGCGLLNDAFPRHTLHALDLMAAVKQRQRPVLLLSQGIGPLENPGLRARAAAVLPQVDKIFIRDERTTAPLLAALGVPPEKVRFTGDDALELAWRERRSDWGGHVGLNLRRANYSGLTDAICATVRRVAHEFAASHATSLRGVPVAVGGGDSDVRSLAALGLADPQAAGADVTSPRALARRIGECRLVVTGSYHAAVFALAQGVPAIGVAVSEYYRHKFEGLAQHFVPGCTVLWAHEAHFAAQLAAAMNAAWQAGAAWRPALLRETERQIRLAHDGYAALTLPEGRPQIGSHD